MHVMCMCASCYHRHGFLSACAYCKIRENLRYCMKIDHTHVNRWVRVVKDVQSLHADRVTIEKVICKRQPELLLDTIKPFIALYMALGRLDA